MNTETLIPTLFVTIIGSFPLYYAFKWAYLRDMRMRRFHGKLSEHYKIIPYIYKYQLVDWCVRNLGGDRHYYTKLPKKALKTIFTKEMNKKQPGKTDHSHKQRASLNQNEVKNGHLSSKGNGSLAAILEQ